MRLSSRLTALWSAVSSVQAATAATRHGHVFLLDRETTISTSHHETIDPPSARLIFAERLGLSDFYEIEDGDEEVIRRINTFGGNQRRLLGRDAQTPYPHHVFILVDGVENTLELVPSSPHLSFFDIDPAPHPSQSQQLLSEMLSHEHQLIQPAVINSPVYRILSEIDGMQGTNIHHPGASRTILHVSNLVIATKNHGAESLEYREQRDLLRTAFDQLAQLVEEEPLLVTVALMPPEHHCAKPSTNQYNVKRTESRSAKAPRQQPESPLELTPNDTLPLPQNVPTFSPLQATSTFLIGPVPTCFSSKSGCESGTNNCTGHGVCSLKFTTKEGDNNNSCFGCVCSIPDIQTNPDGSQKTTWYGGGACQKKDISAPFWLLTGTTIFFVSIISFGVGLLYKMGNEELPSVIGAGVSGPRAK